MHAPRKLVHDFIKHQVNHVMKPQVNHVMKNQVNHVMNHQVNHVMKNQVNHQVLECGCIWLLHLLLADGLYHLGILVNHVVEHQVVEAVLEHRVSVAVTPAIDGDGAFAVEIVAVLAHVVEFAEEAFIVDTFAGFVVSREGSLGMAT